MKGNMNRVTYILYVTKDWSHSRFNKVYFVLCADIR